MKSDIPRRAWINKDEYIQYYYGINSLHYLCAYYNFCPSRKDTIGFLPCICQFHIDVKYGGQKE